MQVLINHYAYQHRENVRNSEAGHHFYRNLLFLLSSTKAICQLRLLYSQSVIYLDPQNKNPIVLYTKDI